MATLLTANGRQKKQIEKKLLTRELLEEYNTLVLSLYSVIRAVSACLRMSTNVCIWTKHGTHRWFEQIRSQNFQNYPPILCPPVGDAA